MGIYRRFLVSAVLALSQLITSIAIASAQTKEQSLILNLEGNQSYETLIQQAETLVDNVINQEFIQNPEVMEVSVIVLGERNGQIVPVLNSRVSRSQWQKHSRVYLWTRYFGNSSGMLLGLYARTLPPTPAAPVLLGRPSRSSLQDVPGFRDD